MEDDLEEREMNVLRQKALSTMPPKKKGYRNKQEADFGIDALLAGDGRLSHGGGSSNRDQHSHYQHRASGREDPHRPPNTSSRGKGGGANNSRRDRDRGRKGSSSQSSSHSPSGSRSYSSYSSSGSSTSGSRSRSSSSGSHSSYSSYTRSSYSSSRHSYSASPHSRRIRKDHHPIQKLSRSDPRPKVSSKVPSHRRYPPSSQWYEGDRLAAHAPPRSPLHARKGHPPPPHPASHSSRDYNDDYPPAKRRPPADYSEYHRGPLPPERHRFHSPPPPPPPPALQRKERVVRHMRRSPLRSPPPYGSRPSYGRGPISPLPRYPPRRGPRRHSSSPPPPPRLSRDSRPKRGLVSDRMPSRPSSRDMRSLCGPPIHVRDHLHRRPPERRVPRPHGPPPRIPVYKSGPNEHERRRRMEVERERRRGDRAPIANRSRASIAIRSRVESTSSGKEGVRSKVESNRKEKLESKAEATNKDKAADEQPNSSAPSLTSPTAQLLWEEEGEEGGDTVHGGEEGEVEELDYDETMEDLDLHPTGNIDEGDGDETRKQSVASDSRPGTVSWDDSEGETGEVEDRASSAHSKDMLGKEIEDIDNRPEDCGAVSGTSEGEGDHISSPIRVSPHRREPRVVKHSPRHTQGKDYSRLSAKERLYVSKNTIEEKKWRISHRSEDTSSKLPRSLANRLGPSPGLHGRIGKRSDRSNSGHHKGSALAIAAEYKRRKQAGELSPREAARATMITKRINESERNKPAKHRKLEERSEENERELDKRIDSIKQMNKALEKRHKEIEEDKQLYG